MITVACVLRSGGIYDAKWVRALYRGVRAHWPSDGPFLDFVCLTDTPIGQYGIREVPLVGAWPGWWSKLELFRPDVFNGPVLYMDLDIVPVGPLAEIVAYRAPFVMVADWYREANRGGRPRIGESSVMAWTPGPQTDAAWQAFIQDPRGAMERYWGDGPFIREHVGEHVYWQDVLPGHLVSYKIHVRRRGLPAGARLVDFHGRPKPNELPATDPIAQAWRATA